MTVEGAKFVIILTLEKSISRLFAPPFHPLFPPLPILLYSYLNPFTLTSRVILIRKKFYTKKHVVTAIAICVGRVGTRIVISKGLMGAKESVQVESIAQANNLMFHRMHAVTDPEKEKIAMKDSEGSLHRYRQGFHDQTLIFNIPTESSPTHAIKSAYSHLLCGLSRREKNQEKKKIGTGEVLIGYTNVSTHLSPPK